MFLLFDLGLQVKASELLRVGGIATLVASIGVVVPFVAGWGILTAWGAPQAEAVFVGVSLVATATELRRRRFRRAGCSTEWQPAAAEDRVSQNPAHGGGDGGPMLARRDRRVGGPPVPLPQ